eukprot:2736736-Rhodomonas_salina.4
MMYEAHLKQHCRQPRGFNRKVAGLWLIVRSVGFDEADDKELCFRLVCVHLFLLSVSAGRIQGLVEACVSPGPRGP